MKLVPFSLTLATLTLSSAAGLSSPRPFESSLQTQAGYDTNPTGMSGTAAAVSGGDDTFTFAANANFSFSLPAPTPAKPSLKISYAAEAVRFEGCSTENYATHRLGLSGQVTTGAWKFNADGSSLFVDGSSETLLSIAALNANAIPLWRERRHQWQHRLKLQGQADFGTYLLRAGGSLLDYDYRTQVVPGKIAFADRSDIQGSCDLGWKQKANSLWLGGIRAGHQQQAIIPLPNCAFDYSNDYGRLVAGWEGKPGANTTLKFAAGPNFSHYSGVIDSRVFLGGRNRTSLWFETSLVAKLSPALTLTGKAAQMDWLSSTGKSAYVDTSAEGAAAWALTPAWTLRFTAKVHRCNYFPAVRDDWESLFGTGASVNLSKNTRLSMDVLRHRGWNSLTGVSDREFKRLLFTLGATIAL